MPKTLQDYEVDELITLLQEFRYRSAKEDNEDLVDEIDSVLDLLEYKDDDENPSYRNS